MNNENITLEAQIPFVGFYESMASEAIEHMVEYDLEELNEFLPDDFDFWEYNHNYRECEEDYCKQYVEHVADATGLKLEFKDMSSPKEYNFTTDRIFASIPLEDVKKLIELATKDMDKLTKIIEDKHSSRDGFISFYTNDVNEWLELFKTPEKLDHIHLCTLLEASFQFDYGDLDDFWECIQGEFYEEYIGNNGGIMCYLDPKMDAIWDKAWEDYNKQQERSSL